MKERFNVEILGISFSIVTDDGEELVRKAEDTLHKDASAVLKQMGRFSKLDAVTLCALDYCARAEKAEAKIRNLEAQIEILEANRRRKDDAPAKGSPAPKTEPAAKTEPAPVKAEAKPEAKPEPAPAKAETAADAKAESGDSSRSRKLRQLEALLGSQLKIELDK